MWRTTKLLILALALLLAFGQAAQAALSQVGPIHYQYQGNPNSGFPSYYMDSNGVALGLLPIVGNGLNAPTQIYDPPDPANGYSTHLGFGTEAFYWMGRVLFSTKNGKATATFGLEAAFVNGTAVPGDEMVFVRIRVRAPVRDPGTYYFYHPWGKETIVVTAADIQAKKAINYTNDVGLVPRGFNTALNGPIGPFLTASNCPITDAQGYVWIGDGASVTTVTGSTLATTDKGYNKITLEAPTGIDLDGRRNNFITANQWTVSGRKSKDPPTFVRVDRATCSSPSPGVEYLDVFAAADPGSTVAVYAVDNTTNPPTKTLLGNMTENAGQYYIHVLSGAKLIEVVATAPLKAATTISKNVLDFVNILKADFTPPTAPATVGSLAVQAISSDAFDTNPFLTVKELPTPGNVLAVDPGTGIGTLTVPLTVPPPSITVESTMGGSDTTPVAIVP